ncbi:LysR family transcriptional regulator [Variovorax sp. GB1P17]|uniref:LysR family transcriptional regulator n=1 Tax=Variovorax sp. GB1P17 TaxID=3443740 RepID=UPI003F486FC4
MLTHKQLRYFVDIVDAGSFSLAAERLFIAQSALSRQVKEMELHLQVQLLARDTRHLEMTPAGRSLYGDARRILAAIESATVGARHAQRGIEGTVQLLHSSSVPLTHALLACLKDHARRCPGVSIEVSQRASEHQALDIEQGIADVGLAREPLLRRYPGVQHEPIFSEPLVVAVPATHALAGRQHVGIAELRNEPFVATPHLERGGLSHRVAELCRAQGYHPTGAQVRSRKWSQLALVQAGFGIAIVPASMGQMAPEGVRLLALEGDDSRTTVLVLWRTGGTKLAQDLVDSLRAGMRAASPGPS